MRKKLSVSAACLCGVLVVFCAEPVKAQDAPPPGEVIKIDAPGILDKPGATYLLTKDVTAERTAFMIKGDGITLDLGGHTVRYGTEVGVDRCSGVFLRPPGRQEGFDGVPKEGFGGGNDFTLKNGRIVQGQQPVAPPGAITWSAGRLVKEVGDHPRPGRYCHAVYIRGCDNFKVTNVTTEVNSRDSNNIHTLYCGRGEIANNHCISTVKEITDRHYPGTQVIHAGAGGYLNIHHNVIDGGGQWGINVTGGGNTGHLAEVHHNVIRHRSYTTNGYALGCHAPGMRVYANVIKSIGRGVHLTANNVDFFNNIVEPREKPNPEYPSTRTHGIKLEHPTNTRVHHNFCRVVAEEGFGQADPLDLDCPKFSANRVYKNTIVAVRKSPKYWASAINVVYAHPESLTQVYDNIFRTNQFHFQVTWGGGSGITFRNNRFEVIGDGKDYQFFSVRQGSVFRTREMVFRDNVLVPPADYRKIKQLYARSYTKGNVDMTVDWSVNVKTVDPAGKAVAGVTVQALKAGKAVAQSATGRDGTASVVLADFHIIGNQGKPPFEEHGPYELVFTQRGEVVHRQALDPTKTTELTVTVTDPKRKLYVYAGKDQRHETNEVAKLEGNVVVTDPFGGKPDVTWRILRRPGHWPIANPNAAKTTAVMNKNGSCTIELEAKLGDEVAKDTFTIRTDTRATPVAVARCPKNAKVNTIVQLDATRSKDPRRFPASRCRYEWKQVAGPKADLSSNEWPDPIFYPTKAGTYTFELTFSNPIRTSKPVACSVVVTE